MQRCQYFFSQQLTDQLEKKKSARVYMNRIPGASLVAQSVKNLSYCTRPRFDPWVRKIPWRRRWQTTPVWASLIPQLIKNLPGMQETLIRFLGLEDPLEKG